MGKLHNRFAVSFSRADSLKTCPRQYYLNYYGHWGGWEPGAKNIVKEIYRLKQLTGLKAWAGTLVHDEIEAILRDVLSGQEVNFEKSKKRMGQKAKVDFRASEYRASNPMAPAKTFGLKEHEYGTIHQGAKKEAWEIAKQCLLVFFELDYMDRVKKAGKENILAIEGFSTLPVRIDSDTMVDVYSIPDLAFREGRCIIIDWKTGRENAEYEDQVALYSLYAKSSWGFSPSDVEAHIVYLQTGKVINKVATPEWIQAAEDRVRLCAREMMGMLEGMDIDRNVPVHVSKFPPMENRLCDWCNFERICGRDELKRGEPDPLAV